MSGRPSSSRPEGSAAGHAERVMLNADAALPARETIAVLR